MPTGVYLILIDVCALDHFRPLEMESVDHTNVRWKLEMVYLIYNRQWLDWCIIMEIYSNILRLIVMSQTGGKKRISKFISCSAAVRMSWRGADGLSLTSRVCPAADCKQDASHNTLRWKNRSVSWACPDSSVSSPARISDSVYSLSANHGWKKRRFF